MTPAAAWPILILAGAAAVFGSCAPAVDLGAEREALLAADRAWAEASRAGDADSVVSFWTEDAKVFSPGDPLRRGRPAIREMVYSTADVEGFTLTWEPDEAVVAAAGDMGYTTGTSTYTIPTSAEESMTVTYRYVQFWRKDADGRWRCVIDMANAGPGGS